MGRWSAQRWEETFRVSRVLFFELLESFRPAVEKQRTTFKVPIPAEKLLTATLYYLATGSSLRTLSELFALGRSIISEAAPVVCKAILLAYPDVVSFPDSEHELLLIAKSFAAKGGICDTVGALDCTHLAIVKPEGSNGCDYYDHECRFSLVAQVLVDSKTRIRDVSVGWPGSLHDSRIFCASELGAKIANMVAGNNLFVVADRG